MVQRLKLAFVWEIWLPVRETGRFVLYPEDSRIIRESWHVCYNVALHLNNVEIPETKCFILKGFELVITLS